MALAALFLATFALPAAGAITEAKSFIASSLVSVKAASAGAQVAGVVSRVVRSADEAAEAAVDAAQVAHPTSGLPRGGTGRAARFSANWQRASLNEIVDRIAGPNSKPEITGSGKQVFSNPETGLQVVYDTLGRNALTHFLNED